MPKRPLFAQAKIMIASSKNRKAASFGKGCAVLLHGVREKGSLNKTAKDMGMAYSKAWTLVKKVEEGLGFELLQRYGARGSSLTKKGNAFLDKYDEFEQNVEKFVEEEFQRIFNTKSADADAEK